MFSLPSLARQTASALILLFGLAGAQVAKAHGGAPVHPLPNASVTGIQRGVDLAMNCDHAIHELLGEYEYCLRSNHDYIGTDAAAETAFRFMSWLRASNAARNGYADGPYYQELFRQEFIAAQSRHSIPSLQLCHAIGIDCASLPAPVPESPAVSRN